MTSRRLQTLTALGLAMAAAPAMAGPNLPQVPVPAPVIDGPPVRLSLAEAVALAVRDNRTIRSAYLARVAQKFDVVVAEGRFRPQLVINASVVETRTTGVAGGAATPAATSATATVAPTATWFAPTGAEVQFSWSRVRQSGPGGAASDVSTLVVTQPLLKGAGLAVNRAPVTIARLQDAIDRLALKSTVTETVTAVVLAYRGLLQAQAQVELAQLGVERSATLLDMDRALAAAGRLPTADIVQVQSDLATQQLATLQARQARNSAQLGLLRLLAVDLRTNVVAADPIAPPPVDIDVDRAVAVAMHNRMDLLAQRKALEQDRQNLLVARNDRLWTLNAVATLQHGAVAGPPDLAAPLGDTRSVGLQLSIPIGDLTPRQAQVHAETSLRQAEVALTDLQQAAEASVRDAAQAVGLSWREYQAARKARVLAAQALDIEREKLKAGRAANFEVLSFESSLRAADAQVLSASITYLNALTTLDEQTGATLDTWRIELLS